MLKILPANSWHSIVVSLERKRLAEWTSKYQRPSGKAILLTLSQSSFTRTYLFHHHPRKDSNSLPECSLSIWDLERTVESLSISAYSPAKDRRRLMSTAGKRHCWSSNWSFSTHFLQEHCVVYTWRPHAREKDKPKWTYLVSLTPCLVMPTKHKKKERKQGRGKSKDHSAHSIYVISFSYQSTIIWQPWYNSSGVLGNRNEKINASRY